VAQYRIGIDIGGTFTDFTVIDDHSGEIVVDKTLTTPRAPEEGVLHGLDRLVARIPGLLEQTGEIIHATTLITNTILERKGAKTALLTTEGFRDVLEMGREVRYDLFDMFIRFPEPLVPRNLRAVVGERILSDGRVLNPLRDDDVRAIARTWLSQGIEAVAVVFLHAYRNPVHEQRAAEIFREEMPGVMVSVSHEVHAEPKEYERTSTTVVDAYVKSVTRSYLDRLSNELEKRGYRKRILVMLSNGGTATIATAKMVPIQIVESGPAAGVEATAFFANLLGLDKVLSFDMGGTTAKLCLVQNGQASRTREFEVDRVQRFKQGSGLPIAVPVFDLLEIGAGGGSIARVDDLGLLQVGPDSAGSEPGPVCYARGGTEPTVTDADLLLGYLNPAYFLGGEMALDEAAARQATLTALAGPAGLDGVAAAAGVHEIVNETMASAARMYVAEKAMAPADLTMIAFGGAGSLHAVGLARKLGCRKVVVPPYSGVMSSLGLLAAPLAFERSAPVRKLLREINLTDIEETFIQLELQARMHLPEPQSATIRRTIDVRFSGQDYSLEIDVDQDTGAAETRNLWLNDFRQAYRTLYGRVEDDNPVELVSLRVYARQPAPRPKIVAADLPAPGVAKAYRDVYVAKRKSFLRTAVYARDDLQVGQQVLGPAVIEERVSTTIIEPGDTLTVDPSGCLMITLESVASVTALTDLADIKTHSGRQMELDPVSIQILWNRLISIVDEAATGLIRTAYTPSVKEYHDFCCALFDANAQMLAHSTVTTAGFLGIVPAVLRNFLQKYPAQTLSPGDVIITNDPWLASGHLIDVSVASPIFRDGKIVAYTLCIVHHLDMGGRMSTLESKDLFEEGLKIPVSKLYNEGKLNETIFDFIRANTRVPEKILGDLRAQLVANHVCERGLQQLLDEYPLGGLDRLAHEVVSRTERSLREKISQLPNGTYRNQVTLPPIPGVKQEIIIKAAVTIDGEEIIIDYTGSSAQVTAAINCTPNIVKSYSSYPIKLALDPNVPNNDGSLRPITIVAPEGSVVNARMPAATWGRTMIAHLFPDIIYGALESVMPQMILGSAGGAPANEVYLHGKHPDGRSFMSIAQHTGGFGGSARYDGYSTLSFPFNTRNIPVEVIENEARVYYTRKEFLTDSGGPGFNRGGLGQSVEFCILDGGTPEAQYVESSVRISGRTPDGPMPAIGRCGGGTGLGGGLWLNGQAVEHGIYRKLQPGDTVRFEMTGGGGYGNPMQRDPQRVLKDVREGKVSIQAAMTHHGVVIDPADLSLDVEATAKARVGALS
jgi:5-oxoprolinase (ATP-hydrolysing)